MQLGFAFRTRFPLRESDRQGGIKDLAKGCDDYLGFAKRIGVPQIHERRTRKGKGVGDKGPIIREANHAEFILFSFPLKMRQ